MKKQYIFLVMILIILYISYLIVSFKFREYKINSNIEYIVKLNTELQEKIEIASNLIEYKTSKAYKNKILKEEQGYKNKGEMVVYLTTEDFYNKFTMEDNPLKEEIKVAKETEENFDLKEKSIFEKWVYYIFKK